MRPSQEDVEAIGWRARTLDELLVSAQRGASARPPSTSVSPAAADPLAPWRQTFARGDRAAFARRLAWDGLDGDGVRAALQRRPERDEPRPTWLHTLLEVLATYDEAGAAPVAEDPASESSGVPPGEAPPFAELWVPFVRHAVRELEAKAPSRGELLGPGATREAARYLLDQLCEAAASAVYERFDGHRQAVGLPVAIDGRERLRVSYRRFLDRMFGGEILPFFLEFSALARQLCRFVDTWVNSNVEFLERLAADRPELERTFAPGAELGRVVGFRGGLSDRHHDGRGVLAVTFAGGVKLVYKPRPLELESAFNDFLAWLGPTGLEDAPPPLRTLARPGYGWVEFAEQAPAQSWDEARAYFRRAGSLLCVAWLLNGRDLHMDNVVATARGPVLVDAEMLLQPAIALPDDPAHGTGASGAVAELLQQSCLATGLLSFLQADDGGRLWDIGGLCGTGGFPVAGGRRVWRHVNTDGMEPVREPVCAAQRQNVLVFEGRQQAPEAHFEELSRGFAAAYRHLLNHREELLGAGSELEAFTGARTRLIFRPTSIYAALLVRLASADFQREGVGRSVLIDALNAVFRLQSSRPALWGLTQQERRALDGHDVPYFSIPTDATVLVAESGERIEGLIAASGIDVVRSRLAGLSADDLESQLELLRSWRLAAAPGSADVSHAGTGEQAAADNLAAEDAAPGRQAGQRFLPIAERIADEILSHAVSGRDGSLTWTAPAFLRPGPDADPAGRFYLYNGAAGIALFLAACARVTGKDVYRQAAWSAWQQLANALRDAARGPASEVQGLGACEGIGGVVYTAAIIAGLLDDGRFLESAREAAALIDARRIAADGRLDVAGGAAGAILGLLALHEAAGDPAALELAAACGRHIVHQQRLGPRGGAAWPGPEGLMLAGFAHGAAGVAYALLRLHAAIGPGPWLAAARAAFEYERTLFSPAAGNWEVLQAPGPDGAREPLFMNAWCHGAPGIALARMSAIETLDDEGISEDLEAALASTRAVGLSGLDHLCCGNLGRGDILAKAGEALARGALLHASGRIAAEAVQRARTAGGFRLRQTSEENRSFQPGFFRGTSGIGYALLRFVAPAALPCVLAFEPFAEGRAGRPT